MAAPTFVAISSPVAVSTSAAPSYPAGLAANDLILMFVSSDSSSIGSAPSGWTQAQTVQTGGGVSCAVWYRTATGSETGTQTVSVSGGTKGVAYMAAYRPTTSGNVLSVTSSKGSDTDTTSTAFSVTGSPSLTSQANDLIVGMAIALAAASGTFSANFTGGTITQATMGTFTSRANARSGTNTLAYQIGDRSVTTGASAAPVFSATSTGANAAGSAFLTMLREITAPTPPTASFTATPSGLNASFDASASTAVNPATVASYSWDFGDSTTAGSGVTTSHQYAGSGTYTVTLTVTDSNGLTGTTTRSVTITAPSGTVTAQSVDVSSGWTASSGTVLSAITDSDATTFISANAPTGLELDMTLQALTPPAAGQPLKVFLTMDATLASTATLAAQLFEGSTQRSSLTGVTIPAGSGSTVTGQVTLTFPWTDVQNISLAGWNSLKLKLQVTAS